ncbi:MAG: SMC family ATPase, partial [Nitrososphaerales archaeon]
MKGKVTEKLSIDQIIIEGFRGINEKFSLELNGKSALILGPNGSGKTSILQAIEWGLYGWLPYMEGAEFEREDAIVNQFHPRKLTNVTLILTNGTKRIEIIRKRLRQKNTRRNFDLKVKIDDTEYEDNEAQNKLVEALGLTEDEFYATIFLHQEAIRDFIMSKPQDRSITIDKMLGTYTLRELIDSIPLTIVQRKRSEVQNLINEISSSITRDFPSLKKKLEELRKLLIREGYTEDMLEINYLPKLFKEIWISIEDVAKQLNITIAYLEEPPPNILALQEVISKARGELAYLDRQKFETFKKFTENLSNFKSLQQRYNELYQRFSIKENINRDSIILSINNLKDEIKRNEDKIQVLRVLRDDLQRDLLTFKQLLKDLTNFELEIKRLEVEYGSESTILDAIIRLEDEIKNYENKIKWSELSAQLIAFSFDYIQNYKPELCPICNRPIEPSEIVLHLKDELAKMSKAVELIKLKNRLEDSKIKKVNYESMLKEMREIKSKIDRLKTQIEQIQRRIAEKLGEKEPITYEFLERKITSITSEIIEIESKDAKLIQQFNQLQEQLKELTNLIDAFQRIESEIQQKINSKSKGLSLLEELSKAIEDLEAKALSIDKITNDIEKINEFIRKFDELLNYQMQKDELLKLEGILPEKEKQLKELKLKLDKLKELEQELIDIRQAATSEQLAWIESMLKNIESNVANYYSRILAHPYFLSLKIEPETVRGKNIYWIKAQGKEESTYIQTRFSGAQLNSVALAIFLTMAKHLPHNLGFIILDDPTQSMDHAHKEALAKILSEEMMVKQ